MAMKRTGIQAPRRIVLTGATRGLGRALVDRFVEGGHVVWGCGRSAEHVAELQRVFGAPQDFAAVDVADDNAVAARRRACCLPAMRPTW
jgi:NADP-dependent 3-hydroxy acid dehydrogenase YdfG